MTSPEVTDSGMTPSERAARWLVREDMGPLSPCEQHEFAAWLADAANFAAYQEARRVFVAFDGSSPHPQLPALRRAALAVRPPWRASRRFRKALYGVAAMMAVAGIVATVLFSLQPERLQMVLGYAASMYPMADDRYVPTSYETATGERLSFTLEDGTEVTLNTNSVLDVRYTPEVREVHLSRGQAFFEVATVADHPFVVRAAGRRIVALGTAFEVYLAPRELLVTLADGQVVVESEDADPSIPGGQAPREVVLAPGQKLIVAIDPADPLPEEAGVVDVEPTDLERGLRWRHGFVEFHNVNLADAVAEMSRYTSRSISIEDGPIANLRVSGVFRTGQLEGFLEIIGEQLPVAVERTSDSSVAIRPDRRDPHDDRSDR